MKLQTRLSKLFNIQPGEGRLVSLMLLYALCLGVPGIVTETTAYSLFLVQFGAEAIPYVYIGFALVTIVIGLVFTKLEARLSSIRLLTLNLTLLLLVLCLLRLLLALSEARWPVVALTIWSDTALVLVSLAFSGLAGHLFTLRQGKRLFGLLGAVFTLSQVVSGFAIPLLVRLVGPLNLLLVAAGAVAGALAIQGYIIRRFIASSSQTNLDKEEERGDPKSLPQLIRQPYVALIFGLAIFSAMTYYFLDNAFYSQVEIRYLEAEALAGFIGIFFAMVGLVTTIFGAFVSGRLISRYGLGVGLLVMPVTLLISAGLSAFVGTLSQAVLFFWLVVMTKFFDEMLQNSVDWSAGLVLYQPLPAGQRLSVQTAVESIFHPVAGGIAGGTLLLLGALFTFDTTLLLYALLPILALWIGIGIKLNRAYPQMLMGALAKRKLSGSMTLSFTDASSLAVLRQALQSPRPGIVIYALNLLAKNEPEALGIYLPELLRHPAPEVRQEAFRQFEQLGVRGNVTLIRQGLRAEPSAAVRAAALRALAAVGQAEDLEQIQFYLEDADQEVRLGALVGLLRHSQSEVARQKLVEMGSSALPVERSLAAQVIGETPADNSQVLLERLLQDESWQVRRAALMATGKAQYPDLWPQVAAAIALPALRSLAAAALITSGETGLAVIETRFTDPVQDREVRLRLARVLGRLNQPEATAVLLSQLHSLDEGLRSQILAALNHRGYQAGKTEQDFIRDQLKAEVAYAAWLLASLIDLGDDAPVSLLVSVFKQQFSRSQGRLFLLLSLLYDRQTIFQTRDNLALASAEKRAYALEVIDTLLSVELKRLVLPLTEELSFEQRLQRLQPTFPQTSLARQTGLARQQRLQSLLMSPGESLTPWLRTCAVYTAGALGQSSPGLAEKVITSLRADSRNALLQETAAWTLARLDGAVSDQHLEPIRSDPQFRGVIDHLEWRKGGGKTMLSTIEKVLILKTVDLFSSTPDEILAEVASLLAEVELPAGKTIFEKGERGDCMYIVVSGRVKAHDGAHIFNYLEEGQVFGEMAVLDPEPRVASITAVEDTQLLRLDQEPFYELMEDRIEVARGVIRVLSGHLRNRVRDVTELKAKVQALESQAD